MTDTRHDGMAPRRPPTRMTRGFVAFLAAMLLPGIFALVVFFGAWAVSDEVYAADLRADRATPAAASSAPTDEGDVAGWKRALVGACPIH